MRPWEPREGEPPAHITQLVHDRGRTSPHQCTRAAGFPLHTASLVHHPQLWRDGGHFKFMLNLAQVVRPWPLDPTPSPALRFERRGEGGRGRTSKGHSSQCTKKGLLGPVSCSSGGQGEAEQKPPKVTARLPPLKATSYKVQAGSDGADAS